MLGGEVTRSDHRMAVGEMKQKFSEVITNFLTSKAITPYSFDIECLIKTF